jgi:hypothetical protein
LQGGVEGKRQVDKVIDKCDTMQVLECALSTSHLFEEQYYFLLIVDVIVNRI